MQQRFLEVPLLFLLGQAWPPSTFHRYTFETHLYEPRPACRSRQSRLANVDQNLDQLRCPNQATESTLKLFLQHLWVLIGGVALREHLSNAAKVPTIPRR